MRRLSYDYSNMSKEEVAVLYEQMEERVQLFMEECTSMSKTNYTIDALKILISDKKEQDIKEWCSMTVEDGKLTDDYIGYVVKEVEENGKENR
ncbi:hypothetical protein AV926_04835 [Myroides marinus]|uniref:Uncharacterized protein n=1 Tax=Myroides marinus TaxID=703342 RepID=A0A164A2G7_9FLAO|nr:hypothetical protein [Myroides marinus]KZE82877.1 hypothetical protein AV926_04835 [Myroides marinus]